MQIELLKPGTKFTVENHGYSKDGELILNGINVKRNIPQKVHKLKEYTVQRTLDNGDIELGKAFKNG